MRKIKTIEHAREITDENDTRCLNNPQKRIQIKDDRTEEVSLRVTQKASKDVYVRHEVDD